MLLQYLNTHFITTDKLLAVTGVERDLLTSLQAEKRMPLASYQIQQSIQCQSFFGEHAVSESIDFYSQGYAFWLGLAVQPSFDVKQYFFDEYQAELQRLAQQLIPMSDIQFVTDLSTHLEREWTHFLDGIYGLCTVSGLPKDIARKEYTIHLIKSVTQEGEASSLAPHERDLLQSGVDLLDQSSAQFAPHEVARSSRQKFILDMKTKYQLR